MRAGASIGPVDLTSGTVSNTTCVLAELPARRTRLTAHARTVPTVTDNLYSQGTITTEVIGILYEPTTTTTDGTMSGALTFGGVDTTACVSVPLVMREGQKS
jgi:hypothetical protein